MKLLLILAMSLFLINCSSTAKKSESTRSPDNVDFSCPDNYVRVPSLKGYTKNNFCVMKYEAKNDGSGNAISQASGKPYAGIDRNDSIAKCTSLGEGYDLITNDEWQSIARNIEFVGVNWATGVVGNPGGLSRGHSDNHPSHALQASSDDAEGCEGTEQTCSNTTWDSQRRTHTLSNGEVIWDIAGNVQEWVKDKNDSRYDSDAYLSQVTASSHSTLNSLSHGTTTTARNAKAQFGPSGDYTSLNARPYGGLGYAYLNFNAGGVLRGGYWIDGTHASVFAVALFSPPRYPSSYFGFRCVFRPKDVLLKAEP